MFEHKKNIVFFRRKIFLKTEKYKYLDTACIHLCTHTNAYLYILEYASVVCVCVCVDIHTDEQILLYLVLAPVQNLNKKTSRPLVQQAQQHHNECF